jgi:SAM-dependent methyltransferase
LLRRIEPFLPQHGRVLDIGCGTGHNAAGIRASQPRLRVTEADVVNMKVVGRPPVLFTERLPFGDGTHDCGLLLFVLHYPQYPIELLREARRVVSGRLIVLQSTYSGGFSRRVLGVREWAQGRAAFGLARRVGLLAPVACPLTPARLMTRATLVHLFRESGWRAVRHSPENWPLTQISRDLFVLENA